ncbi:probable cAMP-dependent protein kinase catalytic subunit [Prunus persica]|uniref:probable cAMP-dependent protein kinase catalytic subunit n=1 Tax=Prunus persica TaxID=3760 RepID=UPI0009AB3567|nr:probable cAMP-dependent protein kinase catalytic subunit [Prunus persica]
MAVKSAEVSDSESIRHEAEVLLDIKGCPFIIERFGEEITTSEEGGDHMVYNLLLEFAPGGTLGDLIEKSNGHGLPEAEPENILLVPNHATSTGSFVAKISDFGLAKKTKENCGQWRGIPTYLSPEALNDSEQEPPSDIWSLGCIVLEMLTGKSFSDLKPGCELEDSRNPC